jgi:hypothetical protein
MSMFVWSDPREKIRLVTSMPSKTSIVLCVARICLTYLLHVDNCIAMNVWYPGKDH